MTKLVPLSVLALARCEMSLDYLPLLSIFFALYSSLILLDHILNPLILIILLIIILSPLLVT